MPFTTMVRAGRLATALMALILASASCGMMLHHMKHGFVAAPPASEFGLGPRTSSAGAFTARVVTTSPLKVGPLQSIRLELVDRAGQPITGAHIAVDGGMPQHGHGLPTKPRVTGVNDDGMYVVDGVRFNMGGWWELRFAVTGAAVADSITFNIRL